MSHNSFGTDRRWVAAVGAAVFAAVALLAAGGAYGSGGQSGTYVLGASVDLTGPTSSTYAPAFEGFRVYIDALNARGGINKHKVRLSIRDNTASGSNAAADVRAFASQNVTATILSSSSGTLGAYTAAMGSMPTQYLNTCYPPSTAPKPAPNFFCVGASAFTDAAAIHSLIRSVFGTSTFRFYIVTEDVPGCRSLAESIGKTLKEGGSDQRGYDVVPLSVTNFDSIARKIVDENVSFVLHYCFTGPIISLARALERLNWNGRLYASPSYTGGVIAAMQEVKLPAWKGVHWFSLPTKGDPVWRKIGAAAKRFNSKAAVVDLAWGWSHGMVMEEALRKCGFPCPASKMVKAMGNLRVATKDLVSLTGAPLQWSPTNHVGPTKAFKFPSYSRATDRVVGGKFVIVKDQGFPTG